MNDSRKPYALLPFNELSRKRENLARIAAVIGGFMLLVTYSGCSESRQLSSSNNGNTDSPSASPAGKSSISTLPSPTPIPTPNKAQLRVEINRYIAYIDEVDGLTESDENLRKLVYGDVDGDGDEDAALQFAMESFEGNSSGTYLAVFINTGGSFSGNAYTIVGGGHYRYFWLKSVLTGKIIGDAIECQDMFPCEEAEEIKREAVVYWQNGKLVVPDRPV